MEYATLDLFSLLTVFTSGWFLVAHGEKYKP